jgi:hypothetical protein
MLELSYRPFVKGSRHMSNIVPLLDLLGTVNDLIPKKDVPCASLPIASKVRFGQQPEKFYQTFIDFHTPLR